VAHQTNKHQKWASSPKLTPVQQAFPNLFPRASDIILLLDKVSLPLLGGERKRLLNLLLLFPLQLSNDIRGIGGLELSACETEPFSNKVKLGGEHVLLLDELAEGIMVLVVVRDIGHNAQVVGFDGGIAKLLESGHASNEHGMEPRGECDRDESCNRGSIDGFAVRPFLSRIVTSAMRLN